MRSFLIKILLFLLPLILLFVFIESYITLRPNSFNLKARYIKKNPDIEVLILGSSHMQNAVDPEFIDHKTANLAYGRQDVILNQRLLMHYGDKLSGLKLVLFELDYHTLTSKNDSDYFRLPWYAKYHHIYPYKLKMIDRLFMYPSSPEFFNRYIFRTLSPFKEKSKFNQYGFVINDYDGVFKRNNYNKDMIRETAALRLKNKHPISSPLNLQSNLRSLNEIIDYCHQHDVILAFITTPAYKTYRKYFDPEFVRYRNEFISNISRSGNSDILYFDFESDPDLDIRDFKNDDHLNSDGAKKFSKIVNRTINDIIRNN